MSDSDAQLELKKRARRRLVGAIALFLAAAIILPMVMDSEPKPSGNQLQIRIPSQEGSNYASHLIGGTPPAPPVTNTPLAEPTASMPLAFPAPAQSVAVPSPAATEQSPPSSTETVASKPEPKVLSKPSPETKPKAEAKPTQKNDDGKRARAILEGQSLPAAAPAASVSQKYSVQLGAYRNITNVKSVQARLKAAGFASTTEKIGAKTRVRAGPFASRAAAERAVAKLKKSGLSGVVKPAK